MGFEYGATAWWTTGFYLDGQTTFNDSTLFTGFRWENRFRPLKRERTSEIRSFNCEYEHIKYFGQNFEGSGRGHDVEADTLDSNTILRQEHAHELGFPNLLLSRLLKEAGTSCRTRSPPKSFQRTIEFGYALGASRPIALKASAKRCAPFAARKFHRRRRGMYEGPG